MSRVNSSTLVGHIEAVKGGIISVRLLEKIPTLMMVDGNTYRIGQIGAFLRVPLGYTSLYAVCTLVGSIATEKENLSSHNSQRVMSATLFGESVGEHFERGISQYPTIGDEVHLVLPHDLRVIYGSIDAEKTITVGHIAASSGLPGRLDLGKLVSRHTAVLGSTGAGKSNLITVLLEAIASHEFPSARVIVVDPHGEFGSTLGTRGYVFKANPDTTKDEKPLYVPYWALPFDELRKIVLGDLQPSTEFSDSG